MEPTPKQVERLQRVETAVKQLDRIIEKPKVDLEDVREALRHTSDSLDALRILVAQTIDAL
jgi:hypothetical protein